MLRLLVRILNLLKVSFPQFTFADVSAFRVTNYTNKKCIHFLSCFTDLKVRFAMSRADNSFMA